MDELSMILLIGLLVISTCVGGIMLVIRLGAPARLPRTHQYPSPRLVHWPIVTVAPIQPASPISKAQRPDTSEAMDKLMENAQNSRQQQGALG